MMPYGRCWSSLQLTGTQTSGTPQAYHEPRGLQHAQVIKEDSRVPMPGNRETLHPHGKLHWHPASMPLPPTTE